MTTMDAATIEETNRIRASLGMKPLPVPGAQAPAPDRPASDSDAEPASTMESREAQAFNNYKKVREAEATKRRREEKASAIRKAREKAQRFAVLEGKGLGEADAEDDDAKAWLLGQKKRQKKIAKARKLEEELAAAEAQAAAAIQYTSKDLAGIKVAHDTSAFLDGDEQVLTLKDTTIDQNEEEGDELENLLMRESEQLTDRLELKKKRPGYNPHDDEAQGGILAQYDEEIDGRKRKKFTLDADGAIAELSDILDQPAQRSKKVQAVNLDDVVGDDPISNDYLDPLEIKIKKPKKKRSKHTRQKPQEEDDVVSMEATTTNGDAMNIDSKESRPNNKREIEDEPFVDDEDLQSSLALSRRTALKKRKRTRPEDLAKQLKEQNDVEEDVQGGDQKGGLVIGEISEFVAGLNKPEDDDKRKQRRPKSETKSPDRDQDQPMGDDDQQASVQREVSSAPGPANQEAEDDQEKVVGEGMGAALKLLRERGLVEESHGDEHYMSLRLREEFLAKKRMLQDELDEEARRQRERDRATGKWDRMSTQNREEYARQQNSWRDHQQSKRLAELFQEGYKPTVNIKYTDEHGRDLDQKEAFKHLSHQFHGKGSGKGKTEKRLKKVEEEQRRDAQSMFDASQSGGMSQATAQQLKKRREAGVRLG